MNFITNRKPGNEELDVYLFLSVPLLGFLFFHLLYSIPFSNVQRYTIPFFYGQVNYLLYTLVKNNHGTMNKDVKDHNNNQVYTNSSTFPREPVPTKHAKGTAMGTGYICHTHPHMVHFDPFKFSNFGEEKVQWFT